MTETAEEKTKRGFIKDFENYMWFHQTTIYLQDYSQRHDALIIFKEIRRRLPRLYPECAILWRIMLSTCRYYALPYLKNYGKEDEVLLPVLTLFTNQPIKHSELSKQLNDHLSRKLGFNTPTFTSQRYVDGLKYKNIIKSIRSEPAHDLADYFNLTSSPQRYGILSKKNARKHPHIA